MKPQSLLRVFSSVLAGRPAPADPDELDYPVCEPVVNGKLVTVELIHVNGRQAFGRSVETGIEDFSKYVAGEVRTVEGAPAEVSAHKNGLLARKQLNPIIAKRRHRSPSDIAIIFVPGLSDFHRRGFYTSTPDGGHVVVISRKRFNSRPARLISREASLRLLINHELCHALGVPCDRSHAWRMRHCTHPECVLYPRMDARSVWTGILHLGPPRDLCAACRREIRRAQQAASGRLFGPADPYDRAKYMDALVQLNPAGSLAYVHRAQWHQERKEYDKAIADLTRAIELNPADARTHAERAQVHVTRRPRARVTREDYYKAIDDYERCLQLKPDEGVARNARNNLTALAWVLATSAEAHLRDGPRAVELTRRLCELTEWKEPWVVATLAAAYAETGQFERAIEYQHKATALADEGDSEKFRQALECYREGKPYRDCQR